MYSLISMRREWYLHMKVEWQNVISDGTVAGQLLVTPHSALTCIMTFACEHRVSEQRSTRALSSREIHTSVSRVPTDDRRMANLGAAW